MSEVGCVSRSDVAGGLDCVVPRIVADCEVKSAGSEDSSMLNVALETLVVFVGWVSGVVRVLRETEDRE